MSLSRFALRFAALRISLCASLLALSSGAQASDRFAELRHEMIESEVIGAGITNERVIEALRDTPRHEFVPRSQRRFAHYDMALPIGEDQTISPPFIVAFMTEKLDPQPSDRVLEIGTGSGYQAAILSPLVKEVYTIEIVEALGRRAAGTLRRLGYDNVHTKIGDGYLGWPSRAPFDKIIVTCSPESVPRPLVEQLAEGGRMVIPVGQRFQQNLVLLTKRDGELEVETLEATLFVPMTGQAEDERRVQPDGSRPGLSNASFEEYAGEPPQAVGWHYQRQMELVLAEDARDGEAFVRFTNQQPGRGSQALQGFAVDGRKVRQLRLSAWVRTEGVIPTPNLNELPAMIVAFYDDHRRPIGETGIGPWRGTMPWEFYTAKVRVPPQARDAIVRVGLLGATGAVSFDGLEITPAP